MRLYLTSKVPRHEGPCVPTWLNRNQVYNRFDGGITGYFRRVKVLWGIPFYKTGEEFHGIIRRDGTIESTALRATSHD